MVHSLFFVFLVVDRSIFYLTTRLIYNLLLSHRNMSIVLITAPVHRYLSYQAPLFVCLFIYLFMCLFICDVHFLFGYLFSSMYLYFGTYKTCLHCHIVFWSLVMLKVNYWIFHWIPANCSCLLYVL